MSHVLPARASSVGEARAAVREALELAGATAWVDSAQLAVSEIVTNALVHAGTDIGVEAHITHERLRVEVTDGSPHPPAQRDYSTTSGTGRGLHLVSELVDAWGTTAHQDGKAVWFEIRTESVSSTEPVTPHGPGASSPAPDQVPETVPETVSVELLNFPLLMHLAWQEHASALLREYLLINVTDDEIPFERHAAASDVMNLLYEQAPPLELDTDPDTIMATAIEPGVSSARLVVDVPRPSVPHFETLERMLTEAARLANRGDLLVPPAQPEMVEMREWICSEVQAQHTGAAPRPWSSAADRVPPPASRPSPAWDRDQIATSARAVLATDERSLIVAASPSMLRFLGYQQETDLVGRRILCIIPARYHQAHIAGTTLHLTNGRGPLLGVRVNAPVVRADGTEARVALQVEPRPLPDGHRIFVAEFFLDDHPGPH